MIHVSELATGFVNSPSDVVKVGQEVKAQVIKINRKKRRIDLSLKSLEEPVEMPKVEEAEDEYVPTAMELALRRAMEANGETLPERTRGRRGKGSRKEQQREMEDIFARTLRQHQG
jgi:ribosomal protein S1